MPWMGLTNVNRAWHRLCRPEDMESLISGNRYTAFQDKPERDDRCTTGTNKYQISNQMPFQSAFFLLSEIALFVRKFPIEWRNTTIAGVARKFRRPPNSSIDLIATPRITDIFGK